jgi:hypothetical protein
MSLYRALSASSLMVVFLFLPPSSIAAEPAADAKNFIVIEAEDPAFCKSEGRAETHIYPRTVGRKMVMLFSRNPPQNR